MTDFLPAVIRGVKLLDSYFENREWMSRIDLETLDLASGENYVFGQLFPAVVTLQGFSYGFETVFDLDDRSDPADYGFDTWGDPKIPIHFFYEALADEWRNVITILRALES